MIDDILAIKGSRDFFFKDYTDFYGVKKGERGLEDTSDLMKTFRKE